MFQSMFVEKDLVSLVVGLLTSQLQWPDISIMWVHQSTIEQYEMYHFSKVNIENNE
jgi:hypothetical protein